MQIDTAQVRQLIQERWAQGMLPLVDGIVFPSGEVVEIIPPDDFWGSSGILRAGQRSTLANVLHRLDPWVSVTPLCQAKCGSVIASAGEGEMGNEGFVTLLSLSGELLWGAFFAFSNPFYRIMIDAEKIAAVNNLEQVWSFSLSDPTQIELRQPSSR